MAVSTTQSIWRSGGGDQTRAAYCGSGLMAAQFYIANAASSANVKVSSANGAPNLVLPKGAVVTSVVVTDAGAGSINLGVSGSATAIATGADVSAIGTLNVGDGLSGTPLASTAAVLTADNTSGGGTVGGYMLYFVVDPLAGQQNV